MKNLAVKYLCTGIVTFVTLCGGMSVSAQNLVVQNPGVLVTKPAGITSVLTPERSIHTDAGITASLRNARDEAMVTRHKADVVKSANGESEEVVAESDSVSVSSVPESSVPEGSEVDSENQENGTEIEATEQPETYEVIREYPITDGNTTKTAFLRQEGNLCLLLFTPFSATRFAMHRIYANRINSRGMSRVFCDLRSQKTLRGILPVNSNSFTSLLKKLMGKNKK